MAQEVPQDFAAWLELLREDARSAGISEKTLNAALANLKDFRQHSKKIMVFSADSAHLE